jgi:hypothetical protein
MKCDEGFPICEKCKKSGRTCRRYDSESSESVQPTMEGRIAPRLFSGLQLPILQTSSPQIPRLQVSENWCKTLKKTAGREYQVIEDVETSCAHETGVGVLATAMTTSGSQSDTDCSNLGDETDWEEDDKSTHLEQIQGLGRDYPLGWMAHKVGEIILRPILAQSKQELVDQLMEEFWKLNTQYWNTHTHSGGDSSASVSNHSLVFKEPSVRQSRCKSRARVRGIPDDEDPGDGEQGSKRPRLGTSPPSASEITLFACPYRKHAPRKYNVNDWSTCALTPHRTVARVKYANLVSIKIQSNSF